MSVGISIETSFLRISDSIHHFTTSLSAILKEINRNISQHPTKKSWKVFFLLLFPLCLASFMNGCEMKKLMARRSWASYIRDLNPFQLITSVSFPLHTSWISKLSVCLMSHPRQLLSYFSFFLLLLLQPLLPTSSFRLPSPLNIPCSSQNAAFFNSRREEKEGGKKRKLFLNRNC